jgi:hypothetical protein
MLKRLRAQWDKVISVKEVGTALAICAGLLLYRFVTTTLSSAHDWYARASIDTLAGIVGWTLLLLFIGLCVWLWRSQRRRTLGVVGALAVVLIAASVWNIIRREREAAERVAPQWIEGTERPLPPGTETAGPSTVVQFAKTPEQEHAKERELTKDEKDEIRKSCKQRSERVKIVPLQQNYAACVFWSEVAARQRQSR